MFLEGVLADVVGGADRGDGRLIDECVAGGFFCHI